MAARLRRRNQTARTYSIYNTNSVKGYFQYDAEQNGDSMTLYVYGKRISKIAKLTKIEMAHKFGSEEFKNIWNKP
jgi:hypothetical protein